MHCPECGSNKTTYTVVDLGLSESAKNAKGHEKANVTRLSKIAPTLFHTLERHYVCKSCQHSWVIDENEYMRRVYERSIAKGPGSI